MQDNNEKKLTVLNDAEEEKKLKKYLELSNEREKIINKKKKEEILDNKQENKLEQLDEDIKGTVPNYYWLTMKRKELREKKKKEELNQDEEKLLEGSDKLIKKAEWNFAKILFRVCDSNLALIEQSMKNVCGSGDLESTVFAGAFKSLFSEGLIELENPKGKPLFKDVADTCSEKGIDISSINDENEIIKIVLNLHLPKYLESKMFAFCMQALQEVRLGIKPNDFALDSTPGFNDFVKCLKKSLLKKSSDILSSKETMTKDVFVNNVSEFLNNFELVAENDGRRNMKVGRFSEKNFYLSQEHEKNVYERIVSDIAGAFYGLIQGLLVNDKNLKYTNNLIPQSKQGANYFAIAEAGGVDNKVNADFPRNLGYSKTKFKFKTTFDDDVKNFSFFDYSSELNKNKDEQHDKLIENMNGFMGMTYNVCWFDGQWLKNEMPPDETTVNFYKNIYKTPELLRGLVRFHLNSGNGKHKNACKVFRSKAFQEYVLNLGKSDENREKINNLLYAFVLTPQIFENIDFENNEIIENKISVGEAIEQVKKSPYYKDVKYMTDEMCEDEYYGEKKGDKYIVLSNAVGLFSRLDLTVKSNTTKNKIAIGISLLLLSFDGTLSVGIFVKGWFAGNWMSKAAEGLGRLAEKVYGHIVDPKVAVGMLAFVAAVIAIISLIVIIRIAINIKKDDGKGELFSDLKAKKFSKLNTDNLKNNNTENAMVRQS